MTVSFTIPGEPQGKGRPRFKKVGNYTKTYTPEKTVAYENLVKLEYQAQCGVKRFADGAMLDMRILAFYAIPKSASKKKRAKMLNDELLPTKKPDMDNIIKVIADGLNKIAYHDDAQIVHAEVSKYYSDEPRVFVEIQDYEGGNK